MGCRWSQLLSNLPGSLQRREGEPRLPEGVDPDAARHPGAPLLRPAGDRPALEAGHREEGARGQEENVNKKSSSL